MTLEDHYELVKALSNIMGWELTFDDEGQIIVDTGMFMLDRGDGTVEIVDRETNTRIRSAANQDVGGQLR